MPHGKLQLASREYPKRLIQEPHYFVGKVFESYSHINCHLEPIGHDIQKYRITFFIVFSMTAVTAFKGYWINPNIFIKSTVIRAVAPQSNSPS